MAPSEVVLSDNIAKALATFIAQYHFSKIAVLVDENTNQHCLPALHLEPGAYHLIQINSGEENKTIQTCVFVWEQLTHLELDRHALVINLGGGVIGDLGGFCAATYKRGIRFVQVPTTLLAQVDASIGGKLGIDFLAFKNHIGVFQNPLAVLIDTNFLQTLPKNELVSGFAEIIKHCLIADKVMWKKISSQEISELDWPALVAHSIEIKSRITSADPYEKGLRKILNFGHTIGHAIESYYLNIPGMKLLHGEAIAIGMICESHLSFQKGLISYSDLTLITGYILQIYKKRVISIEDMEKLLPLTLHDKKNHSNNIQCTLLAAIGQASFDHLVTLPEIREAITFYNVQHGSAETKYHFN